MINNKTSKAIESLRFWMACLIVLLHCFDQRYNDKVLIDRGFEQVRGGLAIR